MAETTANGKSTKVIEVSRKIEGEKTLSFEAGRLAQQAAGSVLGRLGDTIVLATVAISSKPREGIDFFPLTVDVEERMYAAGKIPGSFFRREGRASDQAILTSRLIDRPLRPCFSDGFRNDVHIVATIFGADQENPHDVVAINAASAALMVSGIPFEGPVGAVRMAYSQAGEWIAFPTFAEGDASTFEMVVAGRLTADGSDVAIMMVEAGGTENAFLYYDAGAPKVTEDVVVAGIEQAKPYIRAAIELQLELVEKVKPEPRDVPIAPKFSEEIYRLVSERFRGQAEAVLDITSKKDRTRAIEELTAKAQSELATEEAPPEAVGAAVAALLRQVMRERILSTGRRIDGRTPEQLRPLNAEVGLVPTAHGSGLFERGETQVLSFATLGMPRMNQLLDTITVDESKRYMHHYNFPPFSTGEAGQIRGPRRREIGHGLLAERAVVPVLPPQDDFPYAMRVVSEVLSSNGSTSMASVCGSSLSLMDAGVPIREHVAGVAMGLVAEGGRFVTLTDIMGDEDHFGDMDFKVAGTKDVVTALQLDTKIDGLPHEVLARALQQAREARLAILEVMNAAIDKPREDIHPNAPRLVSFEVPADKVADIIGPKGKTVNELQAITGAEITIDNEHGKAFVTIGAKDISALEAAKKRIEEILSPPQPEIGAVYEGKVVGITKFGVFVNFLPGRDGLIHVSKFSLPSKSAKLEDVVKIGDELRVRVESVDEAGKVALGLAEPVKPPSPVGADIEVVSLYEEVESKLEKEFGF
jgi:polyribonucleotide nucleotidyltransferase